MDKFESALKKVKEDTKREIFACTASWVSTLALIYGFFHQFPVHSIIFRLFQILAMGILALFIWDTYYQEKREGVFAVTYFLTVFTLYGAWVVYNNSLLY